MELRLLQLPRRARTGAIRATPRTQESVAVSADGDDWFLDQRLAGDPGPDRELPADPPAPSRATRRSQGIFLTNGDLDHCLGLLSLRESHPLVVYATEPVYAGFTEGNVLFRTLQRFPGQVTWRPLKARTRGRGRRRGGRPSGLARPAGPGAGQAADPPRGRGTPADPEESIGLRFRDGASGRVLAYFSGVAALAARDAPALEDADAVFFDGDVLVERRADHARRSVTKRAEQMAHLPVGGPGGSLGRPAGLRARASRLRPPQQHEPAPARRLARARGGQRRGLGGGVGRDGRSSSAEPWSATESPT